MRATWKCAGLVVISLLATSTPAADQGSRRIALLVGIGTYAFAGQLEGPPFDVAAMKDVLVRAWGFSPGNVRILVDAQATRSAILGELAGLQQRSAPGDEVLIYFSGHGTSAFDNYAPTVLPQGTGAFVAYDYDRNSTDPKQGLVVGRWDLRPIFEALERSGRRLWVISDSCYSGQQVRRPHSGGNTPLTDRLLPEPRRLPQSARPLDTPAERYPYIGTMFLAAAAEGEIAKDIPKRAVRRFATIDGKPHGAFTDALLRVLAGEVPADANADGFLSLNEVQRATSEFMSMRGYGQSPQRLPSVADDSVALGTQPVLSVRGVAAKAPLSHASPLRLIVNRAPLQLLQQLQAIPDLEIVRTKADEPNVALTANRSETKFVSAAGDTIATVPTSNIARIVGQMGQLAWAHRIHQLSLQHRRTVLPFDIEPAAQGGNRYIGEIVSLVMRPDREASILILDANAEGKIHVVYPDRAADRTRKAAGAPHSVDDLVVTEPEGMDIVLAWAFDADVVELRELEGLRDINFDDARLMRLERLIVAMSGRFSYERIERRAIRKP